MTLGDIGLMDMSSFSVSFQSGDNDSIGDDLSSMVNKMSHTGQQLLLELESAKQEASGQMSLCMDSLPQKVHSSDLNTTHTPQNSVKLVELQTKCEKLEDVIIFLLQENATLSRVHRETKQLCTKCRNPIEKSYQNGSKSSGTHSRDYEKCREKLSLVMEKAAELQLDNDRHTLRIRKMEQELNSWQNSKENNDTYKQRIEDLHNQLLLKEIEIETLKDDLTKSAGKRNDTLSMPHTKDICSRKDVLQLCEKYEELKKTARKMEYDISKLQYSKRESAAKIRDLERQLCSISTGEESSASMFDERYRLKESIHSFTPRHLSKSLDGHRLGSTGSYDQVEYSHSSPSFRNTQPRSILKKSTYQVSTPSTVHPASYHDEKREKNPIIINEKKSTTYTDRCYRSPPREIVDVDAIPRNLDTSYSSNNPDTSASSDSVIMKSCNKLKTSCDDILKHIEGKYENEIEMTSPSSGMSEHIGRYEFLQEIGHLHSKGKKMSDTGNGLSARQQEYADKLVKKYTSGLKPSFQTL